MDPNDTKPWWQSHGTVAAIVIFLSGTLKSFGVIDADHMGIIQANLPDLITGTITQALAIWAFFGRVMATKMVAFGAAAPATRQAPAATPASPPPPPAAGS